MRFGRAEVLKRIGADEMLTQEILDLVSDKPEVAEEPMKGLFESRPARRRETVRPGVTADEVKALIETPSLARDKPELEAIVIRLGRPVLTIRNDDFDPAEADTEQWRTRLEQHHDSLRTAILSVGRIELRNHLFYKWVGTGWVVADDIIVTNRHVAHWFARRSGERFVFRRSVIGEVEAYLDFREEHRGAADIELPIVKVLHIEDDPGPDLAFLRIDWSRSTDGPRARIPLGDQVASGRFVAVIGYPAKDTRTAIPDVMEATFGNIYDVKRLAPGTIMHASDAGRELVHDCTTLGGNSGSVVLDMETGQALGLHFAGLEEHGNWAVGAPIVRQRLEELSKPVRRPDKAKEPREIEPVLPEEEAPQAADLQDRAGYAPEFLGPGVPLPRRSPELDQYVASVPGEADDLLHYHHYSVLMHRTRRIAIYTACNIDGMQWRKIPRKSPDRWYFDPRMDRSYQAGNELYQSNNLDRGHLVRRLDPAWGGTWAEAKTAERDTFFYTNCAPQHLKVNRDLWLGLEEYILDNTKAHDLRVTVFNGPVFRPTDREYRDFKIPEDFWKVVVVVPEETGQLAATAYLLSQRDYMDNLEFAFGEYGTYQVPLREIEALTGLDFGSLKEHDPLELLESAVRARPLSSLQDIAM